MTHRIFILGSNSFAGSTFAKHSLQRGHQVFGVSRSHEPPEALLAYKTLASLQNFQFRQIDINRDQERLFTLIRDFEPDVIVDYAGQGMVAESWKTPEQWYDTNITSKVRIHNFLKDLTSLKKYIRISTPEVYGSCEGPMKESFQYNPSTPYAVSHAAIDMSLKAFHDQYQFPVVFTRFANFYGPFQQLYRIIPRSIIYMRLGKKIPLHGGGHSVRAFIHSDDMSSAVSAAISTGIPGQIYHFSTEEFVSIRQLVNMIADELGVRFEDCVDIVGDRLGKDKAYYLQCDKARSDLDWQPCVNLRQGIRQTVSWVDQYLEQIKMLPLDYIHK